MKQEAGHESVRRSVSEDDPFSLGGVLDRLEVGLRNDVPEASLDDARFPDRGDHDLNPDLKPGFLADRKRRAAVLVPLVEREGGVHMILTTRTEHMPTHAGQVSFPGGKIDDDDAGPLAAALREAHEEIGLPPAHVQLLAELPVAETRTSGFRIAPFLARIVPPPGGWRPHPREIAAVLDVPLADLLAPGAHDDTPWQLPAWPAPRCEPCYHVGPHRLWGVTYRILHPLLPRLRAEEWV